MEWNFCQGCMNEGRAHFTFPLISIKECGYFIKMFYGIRMNNCIFIARIIDI